MQKLVHFSEGVRESLRRLSGISWMAEELHKVAEYYLPHKSVSAVNINMYLEILEHLPLSLIMDYWPNWWKQRISCVHTQILEAGQTYSGSVNALIYYRGFLWSGHSNGSIKAWDIKGQTATLVWDLKEHSKAVTCFSLFEHGESLLSGSSDKTIKVGRRGHASFSSSIILCRVSVCSFLWLLCHVFSIKHFPCTNFQECLMEYRFCTKCRFGKWSNENWNASKWYA